MEYLRLPYIREQYETLAKEAAEHGWSHGEYLERLIEGETHLREDRRIQRRIRLARFPVIKTLEQFQWSWPKKINGSKAV
ncbi:MAG: ATP-binding protein [Gammaproteobacteria bacterium]